MNIGVSMTKFKVGIFFIAAALSILANAWAEDQTQRYQLFEGTVNSVFTENLEKTHNMKATFLLDTYTGQTWIYAVEKGEASWFPIPKK